MSASNKILRKSLLLVSKSSSSDTSKVINCGSSNESCKSDTKEHHGKKNIDYVNNQDDATITKGNIYTDDREKKRERRKRKVLGKIVKKVHYVHVYVCDRGIT